MSAAPRSRGFIGRSRDLATLAGLLERERLVTILGPPGMGKTRLAEHHLERARAEGAVPVFCDLTDATCVDDICRLVARALDVPTSNGDSGVIVEQLGKIMAGRGALLLVLDNFEQVVTCAASTVGVWSRHAPDARILVTSRERLNLGAEVLFDLGPLSLPAAGEDARASEAVQLFVARTRAVSHDYVLTDGEVPTVAAIVRRFEGIPLAIELASARMRVLTSAEILASLGLDVFAGNTTDAPARHASLRQAMAWSWSSLQPWEQAALGQCSVFQGGFGVGAAQAVIDLSAYPGAPPPIAVLEALCNKSLLLRYRVPEEPARARFRLYVGIHEFGREKLVEREEASVAEARHARHFLAEGRAWAAELEGPSAAQALCRLGVETENLLAVHRRALSRVPQTVETVTQTLEAALAFQYLFILRGPIPLMAPLLDGALGASHAPEIAAPLRAEALMWRGKARAALYRRAEAQTDYEQALALLDGVSEASLIGEIHVSLGWGHAELMRVSDAEACFTRAVDAGDRRVRGLAHTMLSKLRWRQGRYDDAIALSETARDLHREGGELLRETLTTMNLGLLKGEAGQLEEACVHCERSFLACSALGLRRVAAFSLANWAQSEHALGRFEVAEPLYERALGALRELGDSNAQGCFSIYLGLLHDASGSLEEARACYEKAMSLTGHDGYPEAAIAFAALAGLAATEGRVEEARERFESAERRTLPGAPIPAIFWVMRGHLDLALARAARTGGDPGAAVAYEHSARRRARYAPGAEGAGAEDNAGSPPPIWLGIDVRLAQISLERALARHAAGELLEQRGVARAHEHANLPLEISLVHSCFQLPGDEIVSLVGKPVLARLLLGLVEQWRRAPGVPLAVEALRKIGWPDEHVSAKAGTRRVYTAVWSLRRLGLGGVLAQQEGGYLFRADAPIRLIDAPSHTGLRDPQKEFDRWGSRAPALKNHLD
jgi:predicted ATPase